VENIIVLILALAIDLAFGEYPRPLHPVVWMGKIISAEIKLAPHSGRWFQLAYGTAIVAITIAVFATAAYWLLIYLCAVNSIAYVIVAALLLKSAFSFRELSRAALRIKDALNAKNLVQARLAIRALVSRDASQLDEPQLVSASLESAAENTGDSLIAPLFYFLILGVPGAVAYRVANTFDTMIGYHGQYEHLGKFAAQLDDVLSFIPARLSGLLLVLAAYLSRRDGNKAWLIMMRDHKLTESPNAGWPMSAMAGALRTRLVKTGHYALGDTNSSLSAGLIPDGISLVKTTFLLWTGICLITEVLRFVITTQA